MLCYCASKCRSKVTLLTTYCCSAAVAWLSGRVGLQYAMLIVPACYAASGIAFVGAEAMMEQDAAVEKAAALRERSKAKARKEPRLLRK